MKNKSPIEIKAYMEAKFPADAKPEGPDGKVMEVTSAELWGAPVWDHDHPTGGLASGLS